MLTYPNIFEAHADEFPDVVAIAYGERELTWSEYEDAAARLANAFTLGGLARESKVGMFLYNCP